MAPSLSPLKKSTQKQETRRRRNNPIEVVVNKVMIKALLEALMKPAVATVVLGLLLLMHLPNSALAASGGRMGGSSWSSSSRSSSSYRSSSYRSSSYRSSSSSKSSGYLKLDSSSSSCSSRPRYSHSSDLDLSTIKGLIGLSLIMLILFVFGVVLERLGEYLLRANSILKLQVGLQGSGRSLQKALNKIAETADTSSPEGLSYILTETSISLLHHPDYYISGYSSVEAKKNLDDCEKRFNQISIEERGKFDEETLINVNNKKQKSTASQKSEGISNEYIVVSMLVATEGVHKLPTIRGIEDLKKAMKMIGSIPSNKILAAEVLWTPQDENDTLIERELLKDYPQLKPL